MLYFLMVNGRLFHRVAAAFPKYMFPYVTPCVFGTVIGDSDSVDTGIEVHTNIEVYTIILVPTNVIVYSSNVVHIAL